GSGTTPTLTNGQGLLVINPAGSTGIAGYVSGQAQVSGSGFSAGGQVWLQINTTGGAVNESVMLAGQPLTVRYSADQGNVFNVSISGLSVNIANVVSVQGNVSLGSFTTSVADSGL